jgi:CRISPR-associated protein Cmr4
MTEYLLYLYAESPVHTGAADSADVLDLPVQREAATGYPVIWGQSLKGALRQAAGDADWVETVFGSAIQSPDENGGTTEGGLAVGDAQLVAMPVPTLRSTFAWMTTEIALGRLARKLRRLGVRVASVPGSRPGAGPRRRRCGRRRRTRCSGRVWCRSGGRRIPGWPPGPDG